MSKTLRTLASAIVMAVVAAPAFAEGYTFGFATIGLGTPFSAAIAKGFDDAAKAADVKTIIADGQFSVLKEANDVDDLIGQNVNALALFPLDSIVAQGWVNKAVAKKIPVVAVAVQVGDPKTRPLADVYPGLSALVTQDEVAAGAEAGRVTATMFPPGHKLKVAIVEGQAGFAEVVQRTQGFELGLRKTGVDFEIVASQPGNWLAEKGESVCQNVLAAHPDVDVFYNQADDMVIGCARAVHAAGSNAKLIGIGGSKLGIAAIKAGQVDGTVCYQPETLGGMAFNALYDQVSGKKSHKGEFISYITKGITKDNISDCKPQW